jgi:tRNA pseudouridine13 synthase
MPDGLPFLTANLPGTGGALKERPEDFVVEELPLYEPSGQGEHVCCLVQKTGLSTFDAIDRMADALGARRGDIGYAGMKDAQAVTRQLFSIWGTTEEAVAGLRLPGLEVQWARRHGNKLRLGHLAGNRFSVKVRGVAAADQPRAPAILDVIQKRGLPNYFGEQRFGHRHNNHLLGAAVIRSDDAALLRLLLGGADASIDDAQSAGARRAFDQGELERAMRLYPRRCGIERRVLARLIKTGKPHVAARAIDERLRRLWVSALQSDLFNRLVAQRVDALDRLLDGDLAWKHDNGAVFLVESAAAEQSRCDVMEISPTGPLVGYRMTLPGGRPLEMEQAVFASAGLKPDDFRQAGHHKVKGSRRPLRVLVGDVQLGCGVDDRGPHLALTFTLPAGSFATTLLREVTKSP